MSAPRRWTKKKAVEAHRWYSAKPERTLAMVGEKFGVSGARMSRVFEEAGLERKSVGRRRERVS